MDDVSRSSGDRTDQAGRVPLHQPPEVAVVVPVRDEAENILPLIDEIARALDGTGCYEIVYVDDGSRDGTAEELARASMRSARLQVVRHRESCGQSAAVATGVRAARAPVIVTLDGDGQNDPADIPRLLAVFRCEAERGGPVLVSGHRKRRQDRWRKRVSSRIANGVRARLLGDDTPDTGCGLKVFAREVFLDLPRFDHMHRFLPALVRRAGGRTVSVEVNHRPRQRGRSKYGVLDRLAVSLFDLLGVMWLQRRAARPVIEERLERGAAQSESDG